MLHRFNVTNVLLPVWILEKQPSMSEQSFNSMVINYLTRYEGYTFIELKNPFAVCERPEIVIAPGKRRQGKGRV
jgi:hypothetical protein